MEPLEVFIRELAPLVSQFMTDTLFHEQNLQRLLERIDSIAREYNAEEYGLPLMVESMSRQMRAAVVTWIVEMVGPKLNLANLRATRL